MKQKLHLRIRSLALAAAMTLSQLFAYPAAMVSAAEDVSLTETSDDPSSVVSDDPSAENNNGQDTSDQTENGDKTPAVPEDEDEKEPFNPSVSGQHETDDAPSADDPAEEGEDEKEENQTAQPVSWSEKPDLFRWKLTASSVKDGKADIKLGFFLTNLTETIHDGDTAELLLPEGCSAAFYESPLYRYGQDDQVIGKFRIDSGKIRLDFYTELSQTELDQLLCEFGFVMNLPEDQETILWILNGDEKEIELENDAYKSEEERNADPHDLLKKRRASLSVSQYEDLINFEAIYPEDYEYEEGDYFYIPVPDGMTLWAVNEVVVGFDTGFSTELGSGWLKIYVHPDGNGELPAEFTFTMAEISDELLYGGIYHWVIFDDDEDPIEIELDFFSIIEALNETAPNALGSFNLTMAQYASKIENTDAYTYLNWQRIKSAYGAAGQTRVFNEIKSILSNKNLTSLSNGISLLEYNDKSYISKIINDYLIKKITYQAGGDDNGQTAYSALILKKTVCAGFAHSFSLLANALNVNTLMVYGTANGTGGWGGHAWNLVLLGNYYYVVDSTWNQTTNNAYLLIGKNTLNAKKDHKITSEDLATAKNLNFQGTIIAHDQTKMAAGDYVKVNNVTASYNGKTISNNATISLTAGSSANIVLGVDTGSKYQLTWSSGNTNVFTVNSSYGAGATVKVSAKGNGTAELRIYAPTGRKLTINIKVTGATHTIKYEPNGGTGTMKTQTVKVGTKTTLLPNAFTRPGYVFKGWNCYLETTKEWRYSNSAGEVKSFKSDSEAKAAGYTKKTVYQSSYQYSGMNQLHGTVVKFYAIWEKCTFTIQYNANGGQGAKMPDTRVDYGIRTYTNKNTYTKPGYLHDGWNVYHKTDKKWLYAKPNDNGTRKFFSTEAEARAEGYTVKAVYSDGTWVEKTTSKNNAVIEFYAIWKKDPNWMPFVDVPAGHWAVKPILDAVNYGIMKGYDETHFGPFDNLTRYQAVVTLWRMDGSPIVSGTNRFEDVHPGDVFYNAVMWANAKGIATGFSPAEFAPHRNITREQLAVMIYNYMKYKGQNISAAANLSRFVDVADVHSWGNAAMRYAIAKGILSGTDNGTRLDPNGTANRAQAAKMLTVTYRIVNGK